MSNRSVIVGRLRSCADQLEAYGKPNPPEIAPIVASLINELVLDIAVRLDEFGGSPVPEGEFTWKPCTPHGGKCLAPKVCSLHGCIALAIEKKS